MRDLIATVKILSRTTSTGTLAALNAFRREET